MLLRSLCDITLNVFHLLGPTSVILAERFEAAAAGDLVETGLREQQQCTARSLLQPEFDERGRLVWIYFGVNLPGEGKEPFGLHFLHDGLPFDVLVARIGNLATRDLTRYERAIEFHTKPVAELTVIRQRTPDPRNRRLELNPLLNTVLHLRQPPGCILTQPDRKRNLFVALLADRQWSGALRGCSID